MIQQGAEPSFDAATQAYLAWPAADPELAQTFCCLPHCSPDQLIRATRYFSGRLKSSASPVQSHYSGPTMIVVAAEKRHRDIALPQGARQLEAGAVTGH
jgi:hypothetical protein